MLKKIVSLKMKSIAGYVAMLCGVLAILVCFFYTCNLNVVASNLQVGKIAVIDTRKIVEKSLAYQDINQQFEKKNEECKKNAAKIQERLQKKFQALEAQKSTLSKEALAMKNEALAQEAESWQKAVYNERVSLDKSFQDAIGVFESQLNEVLAKYSTEYDVAIVLPKTSILYNTQEIDITNVVVESLNKKITAIQVNFESSPTAMAPVKGSHDVEKIKK